MWVANALLFEKGTPRITANFAGMQASCADVTAVPMKTQEVNFSLGCYGCRSAGKLSDDEMYVGIPSGKLEAVVKGLKGLRRAMVGEKLGYGIPAGVAAHNLVGLTGGVVFAVLVLTVTFLRIDSRRKGLLLGIGAGALTIPLGCIPLAIWLGQPVIGVIAFSILPHLVWGAVLGWTVGYGLVSYDRHEHLVRSDHSRGSRQRDRDGVVER